MERTTTTYRYCFVDSLDVAEVRATLTLAVLATENLHGESRVQLESRHHFDGERRTCTIEAAGEVGRDLNRLYLGFLSREFGRGSFTVELTTDTQLSAPTPSA